MPDSDRRGDTPVLSVEGIGRVYPPVGPQRLAHLFARLGGIKPEDFLYGGIDEEDEEDDFDDDGDEEVVERGEGVALDDVSFSAAAGEGLAIYGPPGSGKSVLLKMLAGVLTPTSGQVVVHGAVAAALPAGTALLPGALPPRTALPVVAGMMHVSPRVVRSRLDEILRFAGATGLAERRIGNVPGKRRRDLLLATMLTVPADVILIDVALPPPPLFERYRERILRRREEGALVIMTCGRLKAAFGLADRALTLHDGRLVADGPFMEACAREEELEARAAAHASNA